MKKISVINYHITNRCNYKCAYCFGKFKGEAPSLQEAKSIIDNIAAYFKKTNISDGRINFSGGEPLLHPRLDELIEYTHSLGIEVSLITNASLLTPDRIKKWSGKVSMIGISIDSLDHGTNLKIGRCNHSCKTISLSHLQELSEAIHASHIQLKINVVVSKLNLEEDFSTLFRKLSPHKTKLLYMHIVKSINDQAEDLQITSEEFEAFCDKYKTFPIIKEGCQSMENSYLMIDPAGNVLLNDGGKYTQYGNYHTTPLEKIIENIPWDEKKYSNRYSEVGDECLY